MFCGLWTAELRLIAMASTLYGEHPVPFLVHFFQAWISHFLSDFSMIDTLLNKNSL